jgi:hypothetical protein
LRKIYKVFDDRLGFGDGPVYPIGFKINEDGVERGGVR